VKEIEGDRKQKSGKLCKARERKSKRKGTQCKRGTTDNCGGDGEIRRGVELGRPEREEGEPTKGDGAQGGKTKKEVTRRSVPCTNGKQKKVSRRKYEEEKRGQEKEKSKEKTNEKWVGKNRKEWAQSGKKRCGETRS